MARGRLMRTAATASMVSNVRLNKAKRQAIQGATTQPQAATPAPQAAQAEPSAELTAKLQELSNLHAQGILTDEEFAAKKKQVLGI